MTLPHLIRDPRIREFVLPTRILWTTEHGVARPDALLEYSDQVCTLVRTAGQEPPAILLDFGIELHGGVRFDVPINSSGKPARIRVRFGESASEAMSTPNNDHSIHDTELLLPWMGHQEFGNTGFRFVRIDLLEENVEVQLRQVLAVFLYRPLTREGSFECSDPLLNRIWDTGAYTVHLCMQDYLWDGIKRDRLVWIGDLHPETRVVSRVFGAHEIVPQSLDYVRDRTPLPNWMNGISSYSLSWILCHYDWYMDHGDRQYLTEQQEYLRGLLRLIADRIDESGQEHLDGRRFLEWPTARDPEAINAGLQALTVIALKRGAYLAEALGDADTAELVRGKAHKASQCWRPFTYSKQATALLVIAGMMSPHQANERVLSVDPHRGLSTFYGLYILQARAMAGDIQGCLELIRHYWGGMLQMGATTFWEHFELDWMSGATPIDTLPELGKADIHGDFGDHCYRGHRHSLCHGWAAGPTAWLSEHVLGITPVEPGFRCVRLDPQLGGLEWARGSVPTPYGPIMVEHRRSEDGSVESEIEMPEGIEVAEQN